MKIKEFVSKIFHNRTYRWYFLATLSFAFSALFLVYNFIVGVLYWLVWNFSVSFYYLLLMMIKAIILFNESKLKDQDKEIIEQKRRTLFKIENFFLILIDLALIAPIVLMLLQQKRAVNIGMIPTIAVATYTTYKIVLACINYAKSKKTDNLALHGLKIISLKEAIVSIITLQNTMVYVFGDLNDMLALTTCTSVGMLLSMIAISIFQIIKIYKINKK